MILTNRTSSGSRPVLNLWTLCARLLDPATILIIVMRSGCSNKPDRSVNDAAAENAVSTWWKEFTECIHCPPVKAGTRTAAHTMTVRGRVYRVPEHVQTKEEEAEEADDDRFVQHKLAIVKGFSVKGETVTVVTNLTSDTVDIGDAEELCHNLGSFVWSKRQFGLENIKVIGRDGILLASREGLRGKVHVH
jgi:hypothetical protein